ncbi:MAG: hypothetical protein ACI87A_000845 [Planctomycetota bacterium]|jgi:hypothetical protein
MLRNRSIKPNCLALIIMISASLFVSFFTNATTVSANELKNKTTSSGDSNRAKEYTVKAAFLYNFLNYTTWPERTFANKDTPLVIGIFGKDPFDSIIDKVLAEKQVDKRSIIIKRFNQIEEVQGVHALFLGEMESKLRSQLYAHLAEKPVLTVGDARDMAGKDTCLFSFYVSSGKVRFEASIDAIKRSDLVLSSQLLKLADIVEKRR